MARLTNQHSSTNAANRESESVIGGSNGQRKTYQVGVGILDAPEDLVSVPVTHAGLWRWWGNATAGG